eukprot:c14077_g1_i1 orf=207-527(+)
MFLNTYKAAHITPPDTLPSLTLITKRLCCTKNYHSKCSRLYMLFKNELSSPCEHGEVHFSTASPTVVYLPCCIYLPSRPGCLSPLASFPLTNRRISLLGERKQSTS